MTQAVDRYFDRIATILDMTYPGCMTEAAKEGLEQGLLLIESEWRHGLEAEEKAVNQPSEPKLSRKEALRKLKRISSLARELSGLIEGSVLGQSLVAHSYLEAIPQNQRANYLPLMHEAKRQAGRVIPNMLNRIADHSDLVAGDLDRSKPLPPEMWNLKFVRSASIKDVLNKEAGLQFHTLWVWQDSTGRPPPVSAEGPLLLFANLIREMIGADALDSGTGLKDASARFVFETIDDEDGEEV